ncbi:hypothetical protein J437_LFUL005656 [Ladona fulva]|uniref:Protein FAN n=1 Tax=Ladona fulva TaxID=123851 RepID=A0A8K0NYY4_LADFU|nr:hypothetical protein J437_LFUL005656 [Ladona fulva]
MLDPGEIFFEDFSVLMIPRDVPEKDYEVKKQIGRLKMCSKSIVFDPKDIAKPIIKIPLKECTNIQEWDGRRPAKLADQGNVIAVDCKQHIELLEDNVIAPYTFRSGSKTFLFLLNYVKAHDCLPHLCQLHRASSLPIAEQNSMIAAIVFSRQSRISFDHLWLEDLYEKVIFEVQGNRITPLVGNPGRILLSSVCLYFQPFNNVEHFPVLKIRLRDVKRIIKRRFLLRQVGLEMYCNERSRVEHLLLCLSNPSERDELYDKILAQEATCLEESNQEVTTLQWQNGVISNYEYLHYLNSLADRTYNDLTQYPVFPWVLSDHSSKNLDFDDPKSYRDLSKPVGALNPVRLKRLKDRYEEMPHPKFLYGSHYSAPGFVLFYLVRKYPHYMLCLQNGRFDHPDRMFNSVPDVWKNVQNNMADFKELVPEFFDVNNEGDFCNNLYGIDFGRRHDGTKVGDVELPGWASDSKDFVRKMRNALESDYVSKNLHHWIDLIFGYKQTGEEAVRADNVFYHLCYEGAVDLDSVRDPNQRHALEVQIMEFGQIPKQVFTLPHPCRIINKPLHPCGLLVPSREEVSENIKTETSTNEGPSRWNWHNGLRRKPDITLQSHREEVLALALWCPGNTDDGGKSNASDWHVFSVGHDSLLKMHRISTGQQVRSAALSSMALSACVPLPPSSHLNISNTLVVVASWDNTMTVYDMEYGKMIEQASVHDDAVSCLAWIEMENQDEYGMLASGSWDCTVRLWRLLAPINKSSSFQSLSSLGVSRLILSHPARSLVAQLDHEGRITCLDFSRSAKLLASGTDDGEICLWMINSYSLKTKLSDALGIYRHSDCLWIIQWKIFLIFTGHTNGSVTAVKFNPDGSRLVSCGTDCYFRVFDLKTSMQVYYKVMDEQLRLVKII